MKAPWLVFLLGALLAGLPFVIGCDDDESSSNTVDVSATNNVEEADDPPDAGPTAEPQTLGSGSSDVAANGSYGTGEYTVPAAGKVHAVVVTTGADVTAFIDPYPSDPSRRDTDTGSDLDLYATVAAGEQWRIIIQNNGVVAVSVNWSLSYEP